MAVIVVSAWLLAGCNEDAPTGPDAADIPTSSPGTGTGTLQVMGVVEIGDLETGGYQTAFSVMLRDAAGAPVSEATVTFEAEFGSRTLSEDAVTAGLYTGSRAGYVPGWYRLNVQAGDDALTGLTVIAPVAHTITSPASSDPVDADAILNVQWTAPDQARECRLTTLDYDSSWINGDARTLWVPGVGNPPRSDQRIRVYRRNTEFSTAGLDGTRLSASIGCSVGPIVSQ